MFETDDAPSCVMVPLGLPVSQVNFERTKGAEMPELQTSRISYFYEPTYTEKANNGEDFAH